MRFSAEHQEKVARVSARVRELAAKGVRMRIYHGTTNSTRALRFKLDEVVDVSSLDQIISIDAATMTAVVEPNVPMDKLVRATTKLGLVPAVVPEFPGITVGGAVAGGAGESSSFKYGGVHDICSAYEIVLGNGEIREISEESDKDLFLGVAGTYGSLGILTAVTIRLIPATKYVRLTYYPVRDFAEATQTILQSCTKSPDFVDGILFSKNKGVIIVGYRTDERASLPSVRFTRPWNEWFYLHAEKRADVPREEVVPLFDYLFRYNRGAFWVGKYAFERFHFPYSRITRCFLDGLMRTRMMYRGLQETKTGQQYLVQDLSVPHEQFVSLLDHLHQKFAIYPVWLCPLKGFSFHNSLLPTRGYILNAGIWGPLMLSYEKFVQENIELEEKVVQLGGLKIPYGHIYGSEALFWKNLGKENYDNLRHKYGATAAFPDVYEKVRVREKYRPQVRAGFLRALRPGWRLPLE